MESRQEFDDMLYTDGCPESSLVHYSDKTLPPTELWEPPFGGAATMSNLTYSVVVRDANSWDAKTGIHCLLRDCGHNHRSLAAAARCHAKLTKVTGQWGNGGTTSAAWFNAVVEASDGEQFSGYELDLTWN